MSNPMYGSNKGDAISGSLVLNLDINAVEYAAGGQKYVVVPFACTIKKIYVAVGTATTGKSTQGVKTTAGTCAGTFEVATSTAAGSVVIYTLTDNNVLQAGDTVEIEFDGTPSGGACVMSIVCEQAV